MNGVLCRSSALARPCLCHGLADQARGPSWGQMVDQAITILGSNDPELLRLRILLSESGFQSGAIEAATLTNVQLTSLAQLSESTKLEIFAMRLRELFDRLENCRERYWEISKEDRIRTGLRPQVGNSGYSGIAIIDYCQDLLSQTMRSRYPVNLDSVPVYIYSHLVREFSDVSEVVPILEQHIGELEIKLANAVKQSATPTC
jgi:restriction system protein